MKLKIKIPLLYSVLTLLLSLGIAFFIREVVLDDAIGNIAENRVKMGLSDRFIPERVGQLYPDMDAIRAYLDEQSKQERICITLLDMHLEELALFKGVEETKDPGTWWYEVENSGGQTVLFLKLARPLHPKAIVLATFQKTFLFLLLALACLFVFLNTYMHYNVTKPIQRLNKRLGKIRGSYIGEGLKVSRRDEIGELYNHVAEMESRLRESNQEQVDMIAAITHDIKTPLTSINGFIELLLTKHSLTEQEKLEYIRLVDKKSRHLTELISEFSAYAKNEMLLPAVTLKPASAKRFFESVANEYEAELAGLDFTLTWEHSFKAGDRIAVDEPMLRRVFANLFSNAVRYGAVEELRVSLRGSVKEHEAVFILEDNGVGVPEEAVPHLFQRFFTVDSSRQSQEGGSGLGLASCKSIVERHGGEIAAYSSPMGGLGIRFTLPIYTQE